MDAQEKMLRPITELLTLACLREGEGAGYQISRLINEHSEGASHIPAGCIITYLYRLLECGSIRETPKVVNGRTRTCYVLTPEGEERMAGLIDAYMSAHQAFLLFLSNHREMLQNKQPKQEKNA